MNLLIIAGMPASGKSTLSNKISEHLGYPIIEKDAIKEQLFDTIGFNSYAEKRQLDTAANAVLIRMSDELMRRGVSHIIVNNFRTNESVAVKELVDKHKAKVVTIFLNGDADVFYQRYVERDRNGARHIGHAVQEHYPPRPTDPKTHEMSRTEFAEKFESAGMDNFNVGGMRIEIDATYPQEIDTAALITEIESAFN